MSTRDSFPQAHYMWGTGTEESICSRRLVVNSVGVASSLVFNCTKQSGHRGSHCAEIDGMHGAPKWVQVWWPGDEGGRPPDGTFGPDEEDESDT